MNPTPGNYQQSYYQNANENYEEYYDNDVVEYQGSCGDAPNLRVPDARLRSEAYQDIIGTYARNASFYGESLATEIPNGSSRRPNTAAIPIEYHTDDAQAQYYVPTVVNHRSAPIQNTSNYYPMPYYSQYPVYTKEMSHPVQQETNYVNDINYTFDDGYRPEKHENNIRQLNYVNHQNKMKTCTFHQNYNNYNMDSLSRRSEFPKDLYADYNRKRKLCNSGSKILRSATIKKYPITVKTPKYITKNFIPTTSTKGPSALCLPVVTQPDPALVKRKSKTNQQVKKNSAQPDYLENIFDPNDTYSAHKMHSQGDVKSPLSPEGFETFLDKYENKFVLNEDDDLYNNQQNTNEKNGNKFKEFAKFLKPKVPSSIRLKQERLANMKSTKPLQPRLKLSLDKLLNRLQNCEKSEDGEQLSDESYKAELEDEKKETNKLNSFNYDVLARKCSPRADSQEKGANSDSNSLPKGPLTKILGPLEKKKSNKTMKPLDDHCALDLHRSKSYIVDLIDRALSKELGTVPRDQSGYHGLTTSKAVSTINRHRQTNHKELCYEVTAALTDSIISNATAPAKRNGNQICECSTSDGQLKQHICDDTYIKQLKQLRWGHIRHIQHEARKLADLEEFLEKCGEIDY